MKRGDKGGGEKGRRQSHLGVGISVGHATRSILVVHGWAQWGSLLTRRTHSIGV